MTTAELIRLALVRERVKGYRDAASALLALADDEERDWIAAKEIAMVQADEELAWEASLKRRRTVRAA